MQRLLPAFALTLAASAAVAQVPCTQYTLGTNLGITDETMSAAQALGFTFVYNGIGYTDIQVCDNGYVSLGAVGGTAAWNVDAAAMCNAAFPSIRPLWIDLDPGATGSGSVYFTAVPATGTTPAYAVVTWDGVYEYFGTTPHTFQLFLIDGGAIRVSYGQDLQNASYEWLVGASQGNAAAQNPVSFAALPILTSGNPTFHEYNAGGPVPLANRVFDWLPDGTGGYIVTEYLGCAGTSNYGTGCVAKYQSFYERFETTPSIDLSNTAFRMLNLGTTYLVLPSNSAFVAPGAGATNLGLGDDTTASVTLSSALAYPGGSTSTLAVCSNGFISVQTGNGSSYQPSAASLLNRPYPSWNVWRDFICNATGNVWFEEVAGIAYVTWDNVIGYVGTAAGSTPSTFQLQFELATGNVDFVFGSMDTVSISGWFGGEGYLVGWSPGAGVLDPGTTDLSAAVPFTFQTSTVDIRPLAIAASGAPIAGNTIQLNTTNVPAGSLFGAVLMGFTQFNPGLPLSGIGMDGCSRYNDGIVTVLFFPQGSQGSTNFSVPQISGVNVQAQSVVYCPGAGLTTLGAIASGGLELRIN